MPIGIYRSFLLSLFQSIEGGFLLEIDLDLPGGELAVGSLDSGDSVFQEVLFSLVQGDLHKSGSVESHSGSGSNDDGWEQELVEDGSVDGGQGSAVGSGELSILFNPS